jgi:hypothetical protein
MIFSRLLRPLTRCYHRYYTHLPRVKITAIFQRTSCLWSWPQNYITLKFTAYHSSIHTPLVPPITFDHLNIIGAPCSQIPAIIDYAFLNTIDDRPSWWFSFGQEYFLHGTDEVLWAHHAVWDCPISTFERIYQLWRNVGWTYTITW